MASPATIAKRVLGRVGRAPVAVALGLGGLGGAGFAALGLPVPWLLGALGWLPTLGALPIYVVVIRCVIFAYLRRFSEIDPTSAFFAASPGRLSEMIALSDQLGGDQGVVSLVHGARLLCIVATIPPLAWLFGHPPPARSLSLSLSLDLPGLAALAALAGLGYLLARRLRLPAAPFVGPLLGSATGHLAGWIEIAPPYLLMALAQLVIGSSVGARFSGTPLALIGRTLLLGAGASWPWASIRRSWSRTTACACSSWS